MQRLPSLRPPAPLAACLLVAAGLLLTGVRAEAQVTGSFTDPLIAELTTDPADPLRFEQDDSRAPARAAQPTTFAPASGAGVTGFDSSNARKKALKPEQETKSKTGVQPIAPGTAAVQVRSPYQQPPPPLPGEPLAATPSEPDVAAPGTPPVEYGPVRKPKTRRVPSDEPIDPYEQLGIRAGAFIFYPAIELTGGYDSNPENATNGKGAAFGTVAPELRLQSDWSRHELKANLFGSYTGYCLDRTPTLNPPYVNGTVDGCIDVTRDTHAELDGRVLVSTDNPNSPNLRAGLRQGFNRLELTAKGEVSCTVYQDSRLTDGSAASNDDRNYDQYGGVLRGATRRCRVSGRSSNLVPTSAYTTWCPTCRATIAIPGA